MQSRKLQWLGKRAQAAEKQRFSGFEWDTGARQPVDFWQEQVAFSGGGMVTTDFLYDPNVGVLYGYREDDFKSANGQPAHGGILEGLYAEDNHAKKPAGPGWYAVELDAGKCAARTSGICGCKFDANGNPTECGAAINTQTGDLDIAVAE